MYYGNSVGQVRLLIADTTTPYLLDDDQIIGYLAISARSGVESIRRAAADALDAIASSESLVSKVIKTQDLSTDGPKVAADLRAHADRLRGQADIEDELDLFDVVDTTPRPGPELTGGYVNPYGSQVWGM